MPKARKKPIEIEYKVFDGSNFDELFEWTGGDFMSHFSLPFTGEVYDVLHDSWIKVFKDQVVIKGTQGEFYPHEVPLFYENYDLI